MISDNGSSFIATETKAFLNRLSIKYHQTTPYHPRTNGRCEKFNGVIKISGIPFAEVALQKALHIYNTRPSEHEYSPHYLLFGITPKLAIPSSSSFYTREETTEETEASIKDLALRKIEKLNMLRNPINSVKTSQSYIRSLLAEQKAHSRSFSKGDW
ncbi:putative tkp3 protein, partial [Erysiphe neolycopersici]